MAFSIIKRLSESHSVKKKKLKEFSGRLAKEYSEVVFAVFEPEFIKECMRHWADPDTLKIGLSVRRFAQLTGISTRTLQNYITRDEYGCFRYPDNESLLKIGKFLGVIFVSDWSGTVSNDTVLQVIKAQHPFKV